MPSLISYPDRTLAAAALSGGSWQATAPITRLSDALLANVARSTNALAASSQFQVDLGSAYDIRVVSLCRHNISAAGTVRVTGYSDSGYSSLVADSGAITAWPDGFTAQNVADYPKNWTYCFTDAISARYWKVEIIDTANAAGYIELGRCWLGDAFVPEVGVSYGMDNGYESRDIVEESLDGIPWGDKRTPRRALNASFSTLTPAERRNAIIMQKKLTETDEAYWITDMMATVEDMLIDAFPCFLRKPSPVVSASFGINQFPISIIERV